VFIASILGFEELSEWWRHEQGNESMQDENKGLKDDPRWCIRTRLEFRLSGGSRMNIRRNSNVISALDANWQAEMEGHFTYKTLSEKESDPQRRNALRSLAAAERHHADLWANRIRSLGGAEPV
jgi:rubrerythrin